MRSYQLHLYEEDDNSRELLLLAEHTRFFDNFAVKFVNFDFNFISTQIIRLSLYSLHFVLHKFYLEIYFNDYF